jgi:acetyl esterase/lipase
MSRSLTIAADFLRGGRSVAYGPDRGQRAELHLPRLAPGERAPVAIVLHGGYWQTGFSKVVTRGVCADLVRRGWAAWNVEYRRLGRRGTGGWPMTFADVAAAIDHLATLDAPIDTDRAVLVGHSAGGHLALWAAGRPGLPDGMPGAAPRVVPRAVVALAAVADLERGGTLVRPDAVGTALVGGTPAQVPERYDAANPQRMVPLPVPAVLVHGVDDATVPAGQARDFAAANDAAGGTTELILLDAAPHRSFMDPRTPAWRTAANAVDALQALVAA